MRKSKFSQIFSTKMAADYLGFTPDYVRRMIMDGKIKATKIGHDWMVHEKDLKDIKRVRFPREN